MEAEFPCLAHIPVASKYSSPALRIPSFGNLVHPPLDSEIYQVRIISVSPEPTWHRV